MIIPIKPLERVGSDALATVREEKGFLIVSAGRDAAARQDTVGQPRAGADRDAVPQSRTEDLRPGPDGGAAQNALGCREPGRRLSEEDTQPVIEIPAVFRKRSSAVERFERRAEEIARAAEIGVRALMQDEAKFFPPFVEHRLPEMGDESRFPGRDARQQSGRENANTGVEERAWTVSAEGRDAVPFGLKRRVVLRVPIFRDEERRGAPRFPMPGEKSSEVGLDRRVGVDDQKVSPGQERGGVAQRSGGAEDRALPEKRELRKIRRLMAQVALDLVTQVMEINRYFADAGLLKPPEMCDRERNVQKG